MVSYRSERYQGDSLQVSLSRFTPEDQRTLNQLYRFLGELFEPLRQEHSLPTTLADDPRRRWREIAAGMRILGSFPEYPGMTETLAKVIHDLRGGAYQAIHTVFQMFEYGMDRPGDLRQLFFLVRDQLKMMRNGVPDLDLACSLQDREMRPHGVDLLIEKWGEAVYRSHDQHARILLDAQYRGNVAERCMEFSALDRVVYNLIGNAARHTAGGDVSFSILAPAPVDPTDVRFVVCNDVHARQEALLRDRFGDDLGALFQGDFTTTGSGLGMRIAADLVMGAYGVAQIELALQGGYIGARLSESRFIAWFHWPIA